MRISSMSADMTVLAGMKQTTVILIIMHRRFLSKAAEQSTRMRMDDSMTHQLA